MNRSAHLWQVQVHVNGSAFLTYDNYDDCVAWLGRTLARVDATSSSSSHIVIRYFGCVEPECDLAEHRRGRR